jgi:hypothetical protein
MSMKALNCHWVTYRTFCGCTFNRVKKFSSLHLINRELLFENLASVFILWSFCLPATSIKFSCLFRQKSYIAGESNQV